MGVVLSMLSPTVAHVVRLPEVSAAASSAVAALVVMVVMALLLPFNANVRHDHLGAVAHSHRVPAKVATSEKEAEFRTFVSSKKLQIVLTCPCHVLTERPGCPGSD